MPRSSFSANKATREDIDSILEKEDPVNYPLIPRGFDIYNESAPKSSSGSRGNERVHSDRTKSQEKGSQTRSNSIKGADSKSNKGNGLNIDFFLEMDEREATNYPFLSPPSRAKALAAEPCRSSSRKRSR